jgi:hypothetical protein
MGRLERKLVSVGLEAVQNVVSGILGELVTTSESYSTCMSEHYFLHALTFSPG